VKRLLIVSFFVVLGFFFWQISSRNHWAVQQYLYPQRDSTIFISREIERIQQTPPPQFPASRKRRSCFLRTPNLQPQIPSQMFSTMWNWLRVFIKTVSLSTRSYIMQTNWASRPHTWCIPYPEVGLCRK
jgi:hypothetical protein